jgi:hydroxypyruvate isomerase
MPRFAANVSMMYPEHALIHRIDAAARDGFAAIEVQGPYEVSAPEFRRALDDNALRLVLMNAPGGNAAAGERGLASLPGRERDFERTIAEAIDYARVAGTRRIHVMAGKPPADAPADECLRTYMRNITFACDEMRPHGLSVAIEPINTRDIPGYFLNYQQQAADVIAALRKDNLGLQMDFYHLQIMEGDLQRHLERFFPIVAHVQIANVPDRFEPDLGEINYPHLFRVLDRLGYSGWVGCEYRPARGATPGGTSIGLGWMRAA